MKRRIITNVFLLLFLLSILLLAGCGDKGVSKSQFKKDILEQKEVQTCFTSDFTKESKFDIEEIEITKEQINIDDKEDIIFSEMTITNDYFKIDLSVQCIYNFYDKGNWILDECIIESVNEIIPINGPDKDLAFQYITEKAFGEGVSSTYINCNYKGDSYVLHYGKLLATKSVLIDNSNAKLYTQYKSDVLEVNGYYSFDFTKDGWVCLLHDDEQPIMQAENYKTDYSKALGEFELESQLFYSGRLCIKKIDETSVVYDLQYDMANDYRVDIDTGNDLIATFDALNGEFCIGNNSIQKDILFHLTYNNENDQWSANYYDKFCRN